MAKKAGLQISEQELAFVIETLKAGGDGTLACYQPAFIVDQILCACKYEDIAPVVRDDLVQRAINNLFAEPSVEWERGGVKAQQATLSQLTGIRKESDSAELPEPCPSQPITGHGCNGVAVAV